MKNMILFCAAISCLTLFACKETPPSNTAANTATANSSKMPTPMSRNEPDTTIKKFDATASDLLPGAWQDVGDKHSTVAFDGGKFMEMYDGKVVSEAGLTIDETCATCTQKIEGPRMGCFKAKAKDGKEDCYLIAEIGIKTLAYSMLGSTGKIHKFIKIK